MHYTHTNNPGGGHEHGRLHHKTRNRERSIPRACGRLEKDDDDVTRDYCNNSDNDDVANLDLYEYQLLDESKSEMVAHIAVPLEVI